MNPGAANDFFTRREMPPFDVNATGFSRANALWLMELSRLVYRRDEGEGEAIVPPRISYLRNAGLEQVKSFNKNETQGMLVKSTGESKWAALVFRGTERKPADVIIDLEFSVPLFGTGPIVHRGFKRALDFVWPEVQEALANIDVPLFMTGHSLGAALATLAAARHKPRAVYTFGSPLVGNQAFADELKDVPVFRVVDDIDGVTFVPPPQLGYLHVGVVEHLSENPEPPLLIHAEKIAFDHAPVNYVDRL